ncbi:MAG: toll/interleukin-1 receptor domain-containing protein [Proteobacteria bacterium]|nr:toll/interleukin-1 receptor domain-containing protein [Pseudomonadota bacterium]
MADVFISYAHSNLRQVTPVTQHLQGSGLSLWWDKDLQAGDDFPLVIEREIASAGSVLVLWSEHARNSLWVRAEATEALDNNKLVQARLDGVKPPLPFTIVQTLDLRRWRGQPADQPFPQLVDAVRGLTAGRKPSIDERVFEGPALQDFGSTAALGWISVALIFATSLLTLSLGPMGPDARLYGLLTNAAFGASCLAFLLTLTKLVQTAFATRRT